MEPVFFVALGVLLHPFQLYIQSRRGSQSIHAPTQASVKSISCKGYKRIILSTFVSTPIGNHLRFHFQFYNVLALHKTMATPFEQVLTSTCLLIHPPHWILKVYHNKIVLFSQRQFICQSYFHFLSIIVKFTIQWILKGKPRIW